MSEISSMSFERSQAAPLPAEARCGDPNLAAVHPVETDPIDRRAQLSTLLARIQTNGAQPHEQEIDQIRTVDHLSETEREIVLEIFRFGYEAAEKEHRQDKMWAYQRLLRRLLRHQPLDQPIPLTTPSGETPREMTAQVESPTIEKKARSQENTPNRFRKRALRRKMVRYGVFLGGATALLWTVYADRSLIGGRDLYTLANTNPQDFLPALAERQEQIDSAIPTRELADAAKAADSADIPPVDIPSGTADGSLPIYRTVRQILLREEPRFGAASQIMLDLGARLIVLDINGGWLKVKMEKTGAMGFVRQEFVVPTRAS